MWKYKVTICMCFLICIIGVQLVQAKMNQFELLGKVIYLDAGHGGMDSGASYKEVHEKDINLQITQKLQQALMEKGAIVYMTRDGDYDLSLPNTINRKRSDLSRRSNIINRSKCDLFLSIHLNADTSGNWHGPQIFYNDNHSKNEELAELFQKNLNSNLNGNRDYKKDNALYLQKRVKVPGILVEVGFLSNSNERYLLRQEYYQQKVVSILVNSTIQSFK